MAKNVTVVGSGNWGTVIARIIGKNVCKFDHFNNLVKMYVYEETVNGKKLSDIINNQHENVKYLPGHHIPENVVAVTDAVEAAKDADILIWVLPHKFARPICQSLKGKLKSTAIGLSLIKGFEFREDGSMALMSDVISMILKIDISVLMGANLAGEIADEQFSECTLGCRNIHVGEMLRDLIQTEYFQISVIHDVSTIEVCGALKNIVALGAGFIDGLELGDNTKAALVRIGLLEIVKYTQFFHPGAHLSTFFESCGIADLIASCYGGRNRKVADAFVKTGKTMKRLEDEVLQGQRLQGPQTAEKVFNMLAERNLKTEFPLLTAIHRISIGEIPPSEIIDCMRLSEIRLHLEGSS